MNGFLKENGFKRIRSRGEDEVFYNPEMRIFITKTSKSEWLVGKAGSDNLEKIEHWRRKLDEYLRSTRNFGE